MRISFAGTVRGKRLYSIFHDSQSLFVGTLAEVKRFIVVRTEKLARRRDAEEATLAMVRRPV